MAMMSDQQVNFHQRLQRVAAGAENTIAGQGRARALGKPVGPVVRRRLTRNISFLLAIVMGLVSVPLAKYAIYYMNGLPQPQTDADLVNLIELGVAGIALIIVGLVLNMVTKQHLVLNFTGMCAAQLSLHNLVHLYPQIWADIFARDWVQWTLATSEPNSILFRGMSFTLG